LLDMRIRRTFQALDRMADRSFAPDPQPHSGEP
jgi:hypothetical protein